MRKIIVITAVLFALLLLVGTAVFGETSGWMNVPLKDINSGKTFTISDFAGKPVLLETFAVWCPTCTKQQKEFKKLHEEMGDDIVSISLNVDSNEDESRIREHIARNGFDWYYAVSPPELTRLLIQQFGTAIVTAPAAPVILICEDHSARLLRRGFKSSGRLKEELARGCN